MTRTYKVILEARGGKEVTRELPTDPQAAREMALDIASRNDAWLGSRWSETNGDEFAIDTVKPPRLEELTTGHE